MKKLILALTLTLFSLSALAWSAPSALAEERTCRGTAAARYDNVRVPSGATCTMNGTYIKGNILVERGATLNANQIRLIGSINAEGARSISVVSSRINGNVQHDVGGRYTLRSNVIGGSIQVVANRSSSASSIDRNQVTQDIQVFENRNPVSITNNRVVKGNLQCKQNVPAPTGGGNRVNGNKQDQCARL